MDFGLIDGYLLDATPPKAELVGRLLKDRPQAEVAAAFYEGLERLGARTPDLALMALRLVLAGKRADDAAVAQLRAIVERARSGDTAAREAYRAMLQPTTG